MLSVTTIVIVLAVVVALFEPLGPPVYPPRVAGVLAALVTIGSLLLASFNKSILPTGAPFGIVLASIGVLAVLPPFVGLLEARVRRDGQEVFASERFVGHLLMNVLGAVAMGGAAWAIRSTPGLVEYIASPRPEYIANIALPLAWLAVRAFVSTEQARERGRRVESNAADPAGSVHPGAGAEVRGYSLSHWHQLLNTVYLTLVTALVLSMMFWLLDFVIARSRAQSPVQISWPTVGAAILMIGFLLGCGARGRRVGDSVYLTFLTGMPAALVGVVLWFSLYAPSSFRNRAATAIELLGYIAYSVIVVLTDRRDAKVRYHYFSAMVIAVVIIALVGALYHT